MVASVLNRRIDTMKPVSVVLGCAAFALATCILSAISTPTSAAPYSAVKQACDNMNQQKAGSCKTEPLKWTVGCAGNACFECPIDGTRLCFPSGRGSSSFTVTGNDGKPLTVTLTSSGTNVEAVLKGCDTFANEKLGPCDYSRIITRGIIGVTANTKFVCRDTTSSTDCTGHP
jgi:hypothetical protein